MVSQCTFQRQQSRSSGQLALTMQLVTTQCILNLKGFAEEMLVHDHEEADTLILLHAADVSTRNPFSELHIYSSDTDVFFSLYTCTQTFVRMWYS